MNIKGAFKNMLTSTKGKATPGFDQIANSLVKAKNIPIPLVDATTGVLHQVTELMRIREIEQTKREEIAARKEIAITAINSQKEIILECMRGVFAERAAVLQEDFKIIDRALERNDVQMLNAALTNMVQVIQTSPFQAIQQVIESKGTLHLE